MRGLTLGLMMALLTGSAFANEIRTIAGGETATVDLGATQAVAYHEREGAGLRLTIVSKDVDGDVFRTGILLRDGQNHTLILPADEDGDRVHRYAFVRNGDVVDLWAQSVDKITRIASR